MFLNLFVEKFAEDSARNGADDHVPEQPLVLRDLLRRCLGGILASEAADNQREPILEEVKGYGQQSAGVQRNVKSLAWIGPVQEPRKKDEVCSAANGKKLREGLHEGEDDRLEQGHRTVFFLYAGFDWAAAGKILRIS